MTDVRIVFSDLDQTILATDKSLPARNRRALDQLAERGIEFVPCSGRVLSALPRVLLDHAATHYAVTGNGAVVCEVATGRALHTELLDRESCVRLYERVRELPVTFDLLADGKVFAERPRFALLDTFGLDAPSVKLMRDTRTVVDSLVPQTLERVGRLERVTMLWRSPADRDFVVRCVEEDPRLSWTSSGPHNLEISDAHASKGNALTWLCGYLGIPVECSVAFGDMLNDVSMLRAAGDGVAMANASPEAKAAADHTTLCNDEGGVGAYLEGLLSQ